MQKSYNLHKTQLTVKMQIAENEHIIIPSGTFGITWYGIFCITFCITLNVSNLYSIYYIFLLLYIILTIVVYNIIKKAVFENCETLINSFAGVYKKHGTSCITLNVPCRVPQRVPLANVTISTANK